MTYSYPNRRFARAAAGALLAGGMLLAGPAAIALAEPSNGGTDPGDGGTSNAAAASEPVNLRPITIKPPRIGTIRVGDIKIPPVKVGTIRVGSIRIPPVRVGTIRINYPGSTTPN